ncbi:acetylcholine receptor subunit alpha-like [Glandiceps talaboti]
MPRCTEIVFGCLQLLLLFQGILASDAEEALQEHIFSTSGYNKFVRPAESPNDTVTMNFGLAVTQILDVDEKNQIITTGVWMDQYWTDYRLRWNSSNFSGIESVIIPFEWVWYPDLVLDNSADGDYLLPTWKYVTVYNDGQIWVTPPGTLKSPCKIDVRYFPFDEQFCYLSFGPWEFTAFEVIMEPTNDKVLKENYVENVEWDLYNSSVELILDIDECCPDEAYSTINFTLILRRRPLYYILNILIPCAAMSFLTLAVFYLPPDCGEKMTLSISVLIALSVFSLLVAEIMPPTSDSSPLIGSYLLFNMAVNALSIIMSVVILHFHYRSSRIYRMHPWVKRVFLQKLPAFIGLSTKRMAATYRPRRNTVEPNENDKLEVISLDNHKPGKENHVYDEEKDKNISNKEKNGNGVLTIPKTVIGSTLFGFGRDEKNSTDDMNPFEKTVVSFLEQSSRKTQQLDIEEEALEEWKLLAAVIDRLCLIIFFFISLIGSLAILLSAPKLSG